MRVLAMVLGSLSLISNNFVALQILEPTTWNKCIKETFLDTVLGPRRVVQKDNAGDSESIVRFLIFIKMKHLPIQLNEMYQINL